MEVMLERVKTIHEDMSRMHNKFDEYVDSQENGIVTKLSSNH